MSISKFKICYILSLYMFFLLFSQTAHAVRLKDIASFSGVRTNELVGYGLVVGLAGTGDGSSSAFTSTSMSNMLDKMGVQISPSAVKPKNVAAVMITAKMSSSSGPGAPLDVTVSSLGAAKSLFGGVLLMTPLKGIDGNVYAVAQGALSVGGYAVGGAAASATKNHPTVGRIPSGAIVEKGVPFAYNSQNNLSISLSTMDFGTTMSIVNNINDLAGGNFAKAKNISTISIDVPAKFKNNIVPFMAALENIPVSPQSKARVVMDERTGTVVLGGNVSLAKVAVAHGNLQVIITESEKVSQPQPFSNGETVVTPQTGVQVEEDNNNLVLLEGTTMQELVDGLNAIGATPRDLISIIRALKVAGALHAELEVI